MNEKFLKTLVESIEYCFSVSKGMEYGVIGPANVVDALFAIARSIDHVAVAIEEQSFNQSIDQHEDFCLSLNEIADAIKKIKE